MDKNNYCVIMAGGIGARFWPMSRTEKPKQFIDILGTGETLIQQTFRRFLDVCPPENIYVVTSDRYRDLVKDQLPLLADHQILCEPSRRNTGPCIAYANHKIARQNPDATIVVAPSDHIILREDIFKSVIVGALDAARKNPWLITLGITPSRPDTGYGYIQFNEELVCPSNPKVRKVKTFTEKPNHELATTFLASGDFLWNAGIFIWSLRAINEAFQTHLPEVNDIFERGANVYNTPGEADFIEQAYAVCRNISIDYGIMEKALNVYVLMSDFGWSDLGTWGSLYSIRPKDGNGNAIMGNNVMTYDTTSCIINMPKDKVAVVQGLDDFIVAEDDNILLICKKKDEQQLRDIVNDVKIKKGDQFV